MPKNILNLLMFKILYLAKIKFWNFLKCFLELYIVELVNKQVKKLNLRVSSSAQDAIFITSNEMVWV